MKNFDRNIGVIGAMILVAILFCVYGCKTPKYLDKRAEKHFDKAYRESPTKVKSKLVELFPPKPPIIKQGKTIVVQNKDSLNRYKKIADSLKSLTPKVIKLQDSCGKEANDSYNNGFDMGYNVGKYDAKISCPPSISQTDTLERDSPETLLLISSQNDSLKNYKIKFEKDKDKIQGLEIKVRNRTIVYLSLLALLLISIIVNIFQFKIKK